MVQASVHNNHQPNVTAVAQQLSAGNSAAMTQMVYTIFTELHPTRPAVLHHPVGA